MPAPDPLQTLNPEPENPSRFAAAKPRCATIARMKELHGKVAVVTGAGGGIGGAVARLLAAEGVRLAVCDIDETALEDLRHDLGPLAKDMITARVDIAKREDVEAFARTVHAQYPSVDLLINCAGVYVSGSLLDLSLDDWEWVLSANLWGVIHACHYFIPPMVARREGGHVVNLVSMYGFWASPCVAGYLTSKFAVFGFSESLREDLRAHHIDVSTVCPGIIRTRLVQNMRIRGATGEEEQIRSSLEKMYARRNYGPDRVARAILAAIRRRKKLVLVSPESHLMYQIERFCPPLSRLIARRAAARLFHPHRNDDTKL